MKKVKEAMKAKGADDAKVAAFEKGAQAYAKKIIGGFKDYDFYVGESMDPDGMVVLMNYREDGVTPFVTVSFPPRGEHLSLNNSHSSNPSHLPREFG